ncbi:MAG: alpha-L-fucosidase [Candidatus Poribacteria bacterium]|nr:alpha-L-fucosidase [Candidatus Poribacteria bacterium]
MQPQPFQPTWASLQRYRAPNWFRDAKFGIYLHWGVYSVVERGEWHARNMYIQGHANYQRHLETYGHPSKFGYKDLIPLWKAERFDPDRLVQLFEDAGARYFTPCAVHHDNFDLWNSKHHRWNSVNMGPQKDIMKMWREATLKTDMRFGATTHLERAYSWFNVNKNADTRGPLRGVPYDGADPAYEEYYFEKHDDTDLRHPRNAPPSWRRAWADRIKDLIDQHEIDLLYLDGAVPFQGDDDGAAGREVMAYHYNRSIERHGKLDSVMCVKKHDHHGVWMDGVATRDMERSRADRILRSPWQTDTSIGPWGYVAGAKYRDTIEIIHELIDIVSKNGNLLLNVPPKADGTLDEATERILAEIGAWMRVNGEGLYGTRPWRVYGDEENAVRFVKKDRFLYAHFLRWPSGGAFQVRHLPRSARVRDVQMMGLDGSLEWTRDGDMLSVKAPLEPPCEHAYALQIELNR